MKNLLSRKNLTACTLGLMICFGSTKGHCQDSSNGPRAKAVITAAPGQRVKGMVLFEKMKDGVRVIADLEGLTPGKHGFHIHEKGECEGDFTSAGAHFNPSGQIHGGPENLARHVGDLGNVVADRSGKARYERIDKVIELEGPNSIIGRSIIVHEKEDDYHTQPTGGSGDRIGCGIIRSESP